MASDSSETSDTSRCLERLALGDKSARDELIERSSDRLRHVVRKMLGSYPHVRRWEETDDVLNNALLRLHQALEDVRPESARHFYALARVQIQRELIDLARHYFGPQGIGANHATDSGNADSERAPLHEIGHETHDPARIAQWVEFQEQLRALPPDELEVFWFRWYWGMSFPELAATLKLSLSTVKRLWRKACIKLYRTMDGKAL